VTGVTNLAWTVAGSGDYDGDHRADILWRNGTTGGERDLAFGQRRDDDELADHRHAWRVVGNGDYDGDGRADVLWRNTSTGANVVWRSANPATLMNVAAVPARPGPSWVRRLRRRRPRGHPVAQHRERCADALWRSGNSATPVSLPAIALAWKIVGSGDYNGDRRADICGATPATGANVLWFSANAAMTQSLSAVPSQSWTVIGFSE
jgi:hypothetical protein